MFENQIHHVKDWIVNLDETFIFSIKQGKDKNRTELGQKFDLSMIIVRSMELERFDFNKFNASTDLGVAIDG